MRFIHYVSAICYCLRINNRRHSHFPQITTAHQKKIHERYLSLINKEQKKSKWLGDSMIDLEKVDRFMKRNADETITTILVIDLGGSSLKISLLKYFYGKNNKNYIFDIIKTQRLNFSTENEIESLKGYSWHDWVAKKVKMFLNETKNVQIPKTASLSFSFTIKQTSHSSAEFIECKKHWWFSNQGLKSKDIIEDLNRSLELHSLNIKVNTVMNDAIATYMAGVSLKLKNFMGLIVGTGTNAGYLATINHKKALVNSEWAAFDIDNIFEIDECTKKSFVDADTKHEYKKLEVMVAGLRLVEIIKDKLRELKKYREDEIADLDISKIYEIYNKVSNPQFGKASEFEKQTSEIFQDFKVRAYRILAPMIVAVFEDCDEFSLVTNGTIIGMEYDKRLLEDEIKNYIECQPKRKQLKGIYYKEDASLIGAALSSLIFTPHQHFDNN